MNSKDKKSATEPLNNESHVDLGLESLLHTKEETSISTSALGNVGSEETSSFSGQKSENIEVPMSEFESYAHDKQWALIIEKTEHLLHEQSLRGSDALCWSEAQAWWLRAQIQSAQLPLAVLSAPIEALLEFSLGSSDKNLDSDKYQKVITLVKLTVAELARAHFSREQFAEGMQILSRGRVLSGDLSAMQAVVREFAASLLKLGGSELRLFGIVCKELSLDFDSALVSNSWSTKTRVETNVPLKYAEQSESAYRKANKGVFTPTFFLALVIIIILGVGTLLWTSSKTSQTSSSLIANKLEMPPSNLQVPEPLPVERLSQLDTVLYGMGSQSQAANNVQQSPSNSGDSGSISQTGSATGAQKQQVPKAKEKVDTQGPIESERVRILREQGNSAQLPQDDTPSMVPGPAIAPRFENFHNPRVFEVLRPTNLMLKPSVNSDAVAGLKRGDRVRAEGREGYWLRVRSRQGRIAYVLAEDTQPE